MDGPHHLSLTDVCFDDVSLVLFMYIMPRLTSSPRLHRKIRKHAQLLIEKAAREEREKAAAAEAANPKLSTANNKATGGAASQRNEQGGALSGQASGALGSSDVGQDSLDFLLEEEGGSHAFFHVSKPAKRKVCLHGIMGELGFNLHVHSANLHAFA